VEERMAKGGEEGEGNAYSLFVRLLAIYTFPPSLCQTWDFRPHPSPQCRIPRPTLGDQEDIQGEPFVGPAGHLLDKLLVEAGIDRKKVYVTNAVKHFKWEPRGKRRIHKKPNAKEIAACRPWLDAEIDVIKPQVIVCLGATAAQALLGRTFRVTVHRGTFVASALAPYVMATVHPSSILRVPDEKERHEQEKRFVEDMKKITKLRL
jgi:uracil-DNA glycosylase family protein